MNSTFTHIAVAIFAIALTVIYLRGCESEQKPINTTAIEYDTITQYVQYPVLSGEGKSVLKYTYSPTDRDTVTVENTRIIHDTIAGFTATLDTIQNKDTLHLEFNYPSAMFRYVLSRQSDSIKYINTTITNTVTIAPSKFGFGIQLGTGYVQPINSSGGIGIYLGVGCNYKL